MTSRNTSPQFDLYIDDECYVCSWDAKWMMRRDRDGKFLFKTIYDGVEEGLAFVDLNSAMHLRERATGRITKGYDAFVILFKELGFKNLSRLMRWPGIYSIGRFGYFCFAHLRKRLPRRKSCSLTDK